jgi:hypothetical protein
VQSLFQDSKGNISLAIAMLSKKKHQNKVLITMQQKAKTPTTISIS